MSISSDAEIPVGAVPARTASRGGEPSSNGRLARWPRPAVLGRLARSARSAESVRSAEKAEAKANRPTLDRVGASDERPPAPHQRAHHQAEYQVRTIWVWRRIVGSAFAFITVTLAWYLVKIPDGLISDERLPTLAQVAAAFHDLRSNDFAGATLGQHAAVSAIRLCLGWAIGAAIGLTAGIVLGAIPLARTVFEPVVALLRAVPALILAPLIVFWAGVGENAVLVVVCLVVAWVVLDTTATMRIRTFRDLPGDRLHELMGGLRASVGIGWAAVMAIETVMAPTGLGPMVWSAQRQVDVMLVGVAVAGLIGLVLDGLLRTVEYLIAARRPMGERSGVLR